MNITKLDQTEFFLETVRQLTGGIFLALCLNPEKKEIELRDSAVCYTDGTNVREYFNYSYMICFTVKGSGVNLGNVLIPKDSNVLDILNECMSNEIVSFQTTREFVNQEGKFIAANTSVLIVVSELLEYKVLDVEIPDLYKNLVKPSDSVTSFMDCLGINSNTSDKLH